MVLTILNLNEFVSWLRRFCTDLLRESKPYGCFLWRKEPAPNLLYINDLVWMMWLTGNLNPSEQERASWVKTINMFQLPEGGFYQNPPFEAHSWQHATWRALVSLNMLGGKPRYPLAFLEPLKEVAIFREWVRSHSCSSILIPHHRYTLGAFVLYAGGKELKEAFFSEIDSLQNPVTGFWPMTTGEDNLSSTFLFSLLHLAFEREIPRMPRILDTIIAIQGTDGLFNKEDTLVFEDMDAAFLLNYISEQTGYRREDALNALRKMATSVRKFWKEARERVFLLHPHRTLAICGIYSVLKEALPDQISGQVVCRFPYATTEFLHPLG